MNDSKITSGPLNLRAESAMIADWHMVVLLTPRLKQVAQRRDVNTELTVC